MTVSAENTKYSELPSSELEEADAQPARFRAPQRRPLSTLLAAHAILLVCNLFLASYIFFGRLKLSVAECPGPERVIPPFEIRHPELVNKLQWVQWPGNFATHSAYRGPPNPEVLKAWDRLVKVGPFRVPQDIFDQLNISHRATSVKFSEEDGGGHAGLTGVTHQLHCVHELWKNIYPELHDAKHEDNPLLYKMHLDHCADILRQKIMCDSDLNIITYNWFKESPIPLPNFDEQRKCRPFAKVLQWLLSNEVVLKSGAPHITKSGAPEEPTLF